MPFVLRGQKISISGRDVNKLQEMWDGRHLAPDAQAFASDRAFLSYFGARPDHLDVARLKTLARADRKTPQGRTGGYDLQRNMQGGAAHWAEFLAPFFAETATAACQAFAASPDDYFIFQTLDELATFGGKAGSGKRSKPLGVAAASKLMFFACPELPIFLYDAVAGDALCMRSLHADEYPLWHRLCSDILYNSPVFELPRGIDAPQDWLKRRCFDLMLRRLSPKTR